MKRWSMKQPSMRKSMPVRKGARLLSCGSSSKTTEGLVRTSVPEGCQRCSWLFSKVHHGSRFWPWIGPPFSWVANLHLVESMTQNICSTSAERMLVTVQWHHVQSPSRTVNQFLNLRNQQTSMNYLVTGSTCTFTIYTVFTFNYHIF